MRRVVVAGGGTGGHLYPALNLSEAMRRLAGQEVEILLVGAERGVEARVLPELGVTHRLLPLEPIYRSRPWRNWRLVPSAVRSSREILRLFERLMPALVVGTGGYASGPVVAWAAIKRLRTAIQEQNSYPGLTTRWLAPYVDQLHLGDAEALRHLWPGPKTFVRAHGNPVRWPERMPEPQAVRSEFELGAQRLVLVVGGSQGSAAINRALLAALEKAVRGEIPPLPRDAQLLWATGPAHHAAVSNRLKLIGDPDRVWTVPYIRQMERPLSLATLAISRAGALSLSELCAWGVPSLLVPLPHAAADHQRRNARRLARQGAAIVVEEHELEVAPERLWKELIDLLRAPGRLRRMSGAARAHGSPAAADEIAADLWRLANAQ